MNNYKITYTLRHYTQDPPLFKKYVDTFTISNNDDVIATALHTNRNVSKDYMKRQIIPDGYYWVETLTKEGE